MTQEPGTGKFTATGTFHEITAPLPITVTGFGVYLCLGGLDGSPPIRLELLDPDDEPIQAATLTVDASDPLTDVELGRRARSWPLPGRACIACG